MKVCIIGLGLIGGSIAKDLKRTAFASYIIGVDDNKTNAQQALELELADTILPLEKAIQNVDIVILAIPVNAILKIIPAVLNTIAKNTTVIDLGSTKLAICKKIEEHFNRENFVACHPIAGTENTGPTAAITGLFSKKTMIICEKQRSNTTSVDVVTKLAEIIEMNLVYMSAEEHDKHIAYVSHLSHISSFALGQTVLQMEKNEKNIFDMAGSGFASTVRLAKSSPEMWVPIFEQNAENISVALETYIQNLINFKNYIDTHSTQKMYQTMRATNDIRRVLNGIALNKKIKE